jgi:hypothetical protein
MQDTDFGDQSVASSGHVVNVLALYFTLQAASKVTHLPSLDVNYSKK